MNFTFKHSEKEFREHLPNTRSLSLRPFDVLLPPGQSVRPELEWYENIKTRMLTRYPGESIKSIMFTSASHGGGSTTTAISFAKALAKYSQVTVLLIDANLRTPNMRRTFNIKHNRGLSDILVNENAKAFKSIKIGQSILCVLACGRHDHGAASLFESRSFDRFLKEMGKRFDFIIFDTAPLAIFPESRLLSEKVDGVILVVRSGKIRRQVALRAKKELEETGARLLGVVLNRKKYHIPDWLYKRL
jgi:capsular exopolysaccharide synthesis family protein